MMVRGHVEVWEEGSAVSWAVAGEAVTCGSRWGSHIQLEMTNGAECDGRVS